MPHHPGINAGLPERTSSIPSLTASRRRWFWSDAKACKGEMAAARSVSIRLENGKQPGCLFERALRALGLNVPVVNFDLNGPIIHAVSNFSNCPQGATTLRGRGFLTQRPQRPQGMAGKRPTKVARNVVKSALLTDVSLQKRPHFFLKFQRVRLAQSSFWRCLVVHSTRRNSARRLQSSNRAILVAQAHCSRRLPRFRR